MVANKLVDEHRAGGNRVSDCVSDYTRIHVETTRTLRKAKGRCRAGWMLACPFPEVIIDDGAARVPFAMFNTATQSSEAE